MEFSDAVVNGVPLLLVIIGLVQFAKKLGVNGNLSIVLAMVLGTGLGILYQLSVVVPTDLVGWLGAVLYGLALGLTACGIYDTYKK